jgi:exoribonuclease-2
MELGNIVEYIDHQKILCAVVLDIRSQRLRLLNENNKEVNLSASRLLHRDRSRLDLSMSRSRMVDALKAAAKRRSALIEQIEIRALWEVLNTEQQWIDLETMTAFCFPDCPNGDHQSAVIRAFFGDRFYFRFNPDKFFPNSEEQVERLLARKEEDERRERIIQEGGSLLRRVAEGHEVAGHAADGRPAGEWASILKSYYLFEKHAPDCDLALGMMQRAGVGERESLFPILVRLGEFEEDENLELLRLEVPVEFPAAARLQADELARSAAAGRSDLRREDLTHLALITIDGQSTLDFDDALSLESTAGGWQLGVHIADVAGIVARDGPIDAEAGRRASSIYMPDRKIPMLPPSLADGVCSLKAGEIRPAISTLVDLSPELEITGYRIFPSVVRVTNQLSYFDANLMAESEVRVATLRRIAGKFRDSRLAAGAVHISVPEINLWLDEQNEVNLAKLNRESPGRMLVSEIMILANWLAARWLAENGVPAVFRSQPEPRERLYRGEEGTLFQHWMQRRLLNRFVLGHAPAKHSGLGLDAYVTATSPIRKYFDLVTQRQLRAVFGFEDPYSAEDIDSIIQMTEPSMSAVLKLQISRHRYWLLKYLERRVGQKDEAIVLVRRRNAVQVLLAEYMFECDLPVSSGLNLKPEDLIQVTIQRVNARRDYVELAIG